MTGLLGWLGGRAGSGVPLVALRVARFRHLLAGYAHLLDLGADAAEKQGGEFVFDVQYVRSLVEACIEVSESVVFDLNVMTGERNLDAYEACDRLAEEARAALRAGLAVLEREPLDTVPTAAPDLASAVAAAPVLFRQSGQVACRGIASGPILNLGDGGEQPGDGAGVVLVASRLGLDDAAIGLLDGAVALLLDGNSAADEVASLARQRRLPCIVRLGDASARLASGNVVTVDAEDNAVYAGRVEPLLALGGDEEEGEYRLLRTIRRALFTPTLAAGDGLDRFVECRSLHDLVHLAHSLAGEALAAQVGSEPAATRTPVGTTGELAVVGAAVDGWSQSVPLQALHAGLEAGAPRWGATSRLLSVAGEERCLLVVDAPAGLDLVDACATELPSANYLYCRFAPRFGAGDPRGWRGKAVSEVLRRLDLEVAITGREVSAWGRGLAAEEVEPRLEVLGRLAAWLGGGPGGDPVVSARELLRASGWQRR